MGPTGRRALTRLGLFGNICNNLYQIAKVLRKHSDIDVHLYLDDRLSDPQQRPESDDPELKGRYPDWIHSGKYVDSRSMAAPWSSRLVRELSGFDMLIVSGLGPMFAQFVDRPTAFLVSGGDLTVYPFPRRTSLLYSSARARVASLPVAFWQRRGIRRSAEVWSQPFAPFVDALARLKVCKDRISPAYFPVVVDTEKLSVGKYWLSTKMSALMGMAGEDSFIVFHPSRLMIRDHPYLVATGQWKQNDLLLKGFAEFLRRTRADDAVLVMLDRPASPDVALAREVVTALRIEDRVVWLRPPRSFGFTRSELAELYAAAAVVADDFGIGWFGSVVLEGLTMMRPVVSYVDEAVMRSLYEWHPILSSNSVDGVADHLTALYCSHDYRCEVGHRGRRWIEQYHSEHAVSSMYVRQVKGLAERSKV